MRNGCKYRIGDEWGILREAKWRVHVRLLSDHYNRSAVEVRICGRR